MKKRLIFIFGLLVVLGLAVVYSEVPILLRTDVKDLSQTFQNLEPIRLQEPTLFISDLHLKTSTTRLMFDQEGIKNIVIVGDFFHSPDYFADFGNEDRERIKKGLKAFLSESFRGNVYYISAYSHDPQLETMEFEADGVKFSHAGKHAKFIVGEKEVFVLHGNEIFGGAVGGGISRIAQMASFPLLGERIMRARADIPAETWIIAGHSHVPALHPKSKTANTGSFAGVPFNLFFQIHVGTGILFSEGNVRLIEYPNITPTLFPGLLF